jgi:tetratricopeptide (TPR) repeat protein
VLYRQVGDVLWEAHSVGGLADIALGRFDYDAARAWYQQTLALYRQAGDPREQGNAIVRLSDIALGRCDYDTARAGYEQALRLYQAIPDPCSAGWTLVSLARLDPPGSEQVRLWNAARQAWTSIGREDLVESVSAEFE